MINGEGGPSSKEKDHKVSEKENNMHYSYHQNYRGDDGGSRYRSLRNERPRGYNSAENLRDHREARRGPGSRARAVEETREEGEIP